MQKDEASAEEIDPWEAAERAGIDMSLVDANLRRTIPERVRAHDRALSAALRLRAALDRLTHAGP